MGKTNKSQFIKNSNQLLKRLSCYEFKAPSPGPSFDNVAKNYGYSTFTLTIPTSFVKGKLVFKEMEHSVLVEGI